MTRKRRRDRYSVNGGATGAISAAIVASMIENPTETNDAITYARTPASNRATRSDGDPLGCEPTVRGGMIPWPAIRSHRLHCHRHRLLLRHRSITCAVDRTSVCSLHRCDDGTQPQRTASWPLSPLRVTLASGGLLSDDEGVTVVAVRQRAAVERLRHARVQSLRFRTNQDGAKWQRAVQEHERMVEALATRDAAALRQVLVEHLQHKRDTVLQLMREHAGLPGTISA